MIRCNRNQASGGGERGIPLCVAILIIGGGAWQFCRAIQRVFSNGPTTLNGAWIGKTIKI